MERESCATIIATKERCGGKLCLLKYAGGLWSVDYHQPPVCVSLYAEDNERNVKKVMRDFLQMEESELRQHIMKKGD